MNIKTVRVVIILLMLCILTSCDNYDKGINENYEIYNIDNKEWKSKKITLSLDQISYSATEVPLKYYILKSGIKDSKVLDSIYDKSIEERVIEIEFEHQDKKDLLLEDFTDKSYSDAVKYMSFFIEKDFKVVTESNDTIKCSGVNFERNFKVAPFKRLLLYFNNIDPNENIKLIYNDVLFGNGIIEFNFKELPLKL